MSTGGTCAGIRRAGGVVAGGTPDKAGQLPSARQPMSRRQKPPGQSILSTAA
ncbi:MAG: hypothetical protein KatS3mg118_1524 [Paracoccaceae bacterium]|nr:MAG: hypothetical protein KatS3mg118_1524 [Paracoccaceae bacterium]